MKFKRARMFVIPLITFLITSAIVQSAEGATPKTTKIGDPCPKQRVEKQVGGEWLFCTKLGATQTWQISISRIQNSIWLDINKRREALPEVSTLLEVHYSPTVDKKAADIQLEKLNAAARLWQTQYLPDRALPVLFFTEKDRKWFISEMRAIGTYSENQLANFDNEVSRNGSRGNWAGVTGDGGRLWVTFMIGTARKTSDLNDFQVAAHEYTHLAQHAISSSDNLTCWQVEGGAAFYGLYLGADTKKQLTSFIKQRNVERGFAGFDGLIKQSSTNWGKLLDKYGTGYNSRVCGPDGAYQVGGVAHEYLYYLVGHNGIINMLSNIAIEKDFENGIAKTFGKSWSVLKKEISNYISLSVAQN